MEESSCVLVKGIWGSAVVGVFLVVHWIILVGHVVRRRRHGYIEKWIETPPGLLPPDAFSYLTRSIRYFVSASQLMPGQILWRVIREPNRSRVHDTHELLLLILAGAALAIPSLAGHLLPFFALWAIEYLSVGAYYVVYISGLPAHLRRLVQMPIAFRMFLDEIVAYAMVAIFSAATYRAHAAYFGLAESTAPVRDALYASIITMTTLGYGDYAPRECLRWVATTQVVVGVVIILVGFALAIARFAGYLQNGGGLPPND